MVVEAKQQRQREYVNKYRDAWTVLEVFKPWPEGNPEGLRAYALMVFSKRRRKIGLPAHVHKHRNAWIVLEGTYIQGVGYCVPGTPIFKAR